MNSTMIHQAMFGLLLASIAVALFLPFAGCKEETSTTITGASSTSSSLIDPSIKPLVLYTYPADRAVGPFPSLYAPGANQSNPFFYVQFNKLMAERSYLPPCYECLGFDYPVAFEARAGEPSTILYFDIYRPYSYHRSRYEVGRVYTFLLDSNVQDVNGNRLSRPYAFSFTPEPYFRVTSTTPANGGMFQNANAYFEMIFNSVVDSTILSHVQISPNVAGQWTRDHDSLGFLFTPSTYFRPSTDYTIGIDGGASDLYGHSVNVPYTTRVSTMPMKVQSADVLPYSERLNGAAMSSFISITFSFPVDSLSVPAAITITPATPITLVGGQMARFFATNDFAPSTDYHVSISTGLRAFDGTHLSAPYAFSFRTDRFRFLFGTYDVYGRIEMFFSGRINMSSLQAAFSITPQLSGYFTGDDSPATSQNGAEYWFNPSPPLQRGVLYKVRLDANLTSIGGFQLAQPDSFQFGF